MIQQRTLRTMAAVVALLALAPFARAQVNLRISPNMTLSAGGSQIRLSGNWENDGAFLPDAGTLVFNGAENQSLSGSSLQAFHDLHVVKSGGSLMLHANLSVGGLLALSGGDVALNGTTLAFGEAGRLQETPGSTLTGPLGYVTATRILSAPSGENVSGLGATISSTAELGSTSVTRQHGSLLVEAQQSVQRSFDIRPATNAGLNATLSFGYDESELNGLSEAELQLARSLDGVGWTLLAGHIDATSNTVTLSGIDAFSTWTLVGGGNAPVTETSSLPAGDPEPVLLNDVSLDFSGLDAATEVSVTLYSEAPAELPLFYVPVLGGYYNIQQSGATTFSADVCFSLEGLDPTVDPTTITITKRPEGSDVWNELTTELRPDSTDPTEICAVGVNGFSDFVVVQRALPQIVSVAVAPVPVFVGAELAAAAELDGPTNGVSAQWSWGDGSASDGLVAPTVTGSHVYAEAGLFRVGLRLAGPGGEITWGEDPLAVVVDPEAGFITGSGTVLSEAPEGKIRVETEARYLDGVRPSGRLQIKGGPISFTSDEVSWLVVTDERAFLAGFGKIDGGDDGAHGFLLAVDDGKKSDRIRIKIWNRTTGAVVHDTQPGAPEEAGPTAEIAGGNLTVHHAGHGRAGKSSAVMALPPGLPREFVLDQNYPNPFNPQTAIRFGLPTSRHVRLTIYDMVGRELVTLVEDVLDAGYHAVTWDASSAASGTYVYQITAGDFSSVRLMQVIK